LIRVAQSTLSRVEEEPCFAFVSSRGGQADVSLLDLQTRNVRNLTNHPGGNYRPAFSPDGQWIAFTSDRDSDGARAPRVFVMNVDGANRRVLFESATRVGDGTGMVAAR
jgi:Tol biopolymer transport system component